VRVAAGAAHKPLLSAVPRASNMTSDVAEFDLGVRRARCVATRASLGPRCDSALAAPVRATAASIPSPLAACAGVIRQSRGITSLTRRCRWMPAPLLLPLLAPLLLPLPWTVLAAGHCCCWPP